MSSLTVIIPINVITDEVKALLPKAIDSVENLDYDLDIMFAGPEDVINSLKTEVNLPSLPTSYIINAETDFCSLVNAAAAKVTAPYFSVLEFDDVYTKTWLDNVEKYMATVPDAGAYLPLTELLDIQKTENQFVGFLNEIAWARSYSDELGHITYDSLLTYYDYNMSGAVIRTDAFNKVGGLKPSIKLFFWYEFMLRLTNNGHKIYVVPKVGYKHFVNRPGSITSEYNNNLSKEEAEFWLETSKQECFFKNDRKKTYGEEE